VSQMSEAMQQHDDPTPTFGQRKNHNTKIHRFFIVITSVDNTTV
jgi:hypothetical protein